jgi:hypothetical protein
VLRLLVRTRWLDRREHRRTAGAVVADAAGLNALEGGGHGWFL